MKVIMNFRKHSGLTQAALLLLFSAVLQGSAFSQNALDPYEIFRSDLNTWFNTRVDGTHSSEIVQFAPPVLIDSALFSNDKIVAQRAILDLADLIPRPVK